MFCCLCEPVFGLISAASKKAVVVETSLPVVKVFMVGLTSMNVENRFVLFWHGAIGEMAASLEPFPLVIRRYLSV